MDGDGDLDALFGGGIHDRLYLNDGTGVFSDMTVGLLPTHWDWTSSVAFGDMDGDGDLDAVIGNWDSGQNRLYLNDGIGMFSDATPTHWPIDSDWTTCVALGDVDGDGDLDVLFGQGWPIYQNRLYLNDGTGVCSDVTASQLPTDTDGTSSVAFGDMDGDGDLDAVIANGGRNRLYRNDGTGVFSSEDLPPHPSNHAPYGVALGDLDGDGDLDALMATSGQNRLYLNDGSGLFLDATIASIPANLDWTPAVGLGDVDGDGDLDALLGYWDVDNHLYLNLSRHLVVDPDPSIGQVAAFDLIGHASPGGFWGLIVSAGTANFPIPGWEGALLLDPFSPVFFMAQSGALSVSGDASLAIPVPGNPGLVGLSLYWQAAYVSPAGFSNLRVTILQALTAQAAEHAPRPAVGPCGDFVVRERWYAREGSNPQPPDP